jgi:hypothetical protein
VFIFHGYINTCCNVSKACFTYYKLMHEMNDAHTLELDD